MRLFFALCLDERVARRLSALACACAERCGGKPMRQETMHLTLAFLGEVDAARLPELLAAARRVAQPRLSLAIDTVGYWRHNRLLWAGSSQPCAALDRLAEALRAELDAAGFVVAGEGRGFSPHATLVRKVAAVAPADLPSISRISWACRRFVLLASERSADRAGYRLVAEFPLLAAV